MIDTHAHLDACADPPDLLLARARKAGVDRVITVGTTIDSCRTALETAAREQGVFAVLGVHPHEAGGREADRIDELRDLLGQHPAVGVGETGLDFFRDYAPRAAQLRLFERHLELASELGKPLVIHTRDAEDDVASALAGFAGPVILHCFSSPRLLPAALERRYYVSFAGNVTFPKAEELRTAAAQVPADRLLVETDSPYLAPQPRRGRPNEPANVVHTIAALAAARGEDPAELAIQIDRNADAALSLQ